MSLPTLNIIRGDYKKFCFMRRNYRQIVITEVPDNVYFTIKKSSANKEFLIQKKLSDGTITFNEQTNLYSFAIKPEDTDNLDYGKYRFDIEVMLDRHRPRTICSGTFEIKPEITWMENE